MDMDHITERVRKLFAMARADPQYYAMGGEFNKLEEAFGELTSKMTGEEQDIVWGFVCMSEQMNWRIWN